MVKSFLSSIRITSSLGSIGLIAIAPMIAKAAPMNGAIKANPGLFAPAHNSKSRSMPI